MTISPDLLYSHRLLNSSVIIIHGGINMLQKHMIYPFIPQKSKLLTAKTTQCMLKYKREFLFSKNGLIDNLRQGRHI